MHFPKASDYCGNNTFIKKLDSSLLCGICDFVCTFPHYRSRFKIRRRVALGSIEEIFLYTENQLYLVGGTNSCSCNVHLNLSFQKRWDFNKRGQKSHTQKNKCSPSYNVGDQGPILTWFTWFTWVTWFTWLTSCVRQGQHLVNRLSKLFRRTTPLKLLSMWRKSAKMAVSSLSLHRPFSQEGVHSSTTCVSLPYLS